MTKSISENCLTACNKCQGNLDCSDYSLVSGILVTYLTTNFSSSQLLYPTIFCYIIVNTYVIMQVKCKCNNAGDNCPTIQD